MRVCEHRDRESYRDCKIARDCIIAPARTHPHDASRDALLLSPASLGRLGFVSTARFPIVRHLDLLGCHDLPSRHPHSCGKEIREATALRKAYSAFLH